MIKRFINILSGELLNNVFNSLIGIKMAKYKKGDSVSFLVVNGKEKGFIDAIQYRKSGDLMSVDNEELQYRISVNKKSNPENYFTLRENNLNSCRILLFEKIKKQKL